MIIPGEVWKKLNASDRTTLSVLGAISALCAITATISFQSSIKHYSQSYFKLSDESYQAVQGALVFVAIIALFVLKVLAAASAEQKPEASPDSVSASKKVTFSKKLGINQDPPPVAIAASSSSSSAPVIVPATTASATSVVEAPVASSTYFGQGTSFTFDHIRRYAATCRK